MGSAVPSAGPTHLHVDDGHGLLHLGVVPAGAVHSLRHELEHEVEVHIIALCER